MSKGSGSLTIANSFQHELQCYEDAAEPCQCIQLDQSLPYDTNVNAVKNSYVKFKQTQG